MIDVLGPEKRRRRSVQEKIAIVQQSLEPGMTVSLVARQHGVAASQLFLWRKQYQRKRTARTVLTGMCYSVGSVMRQGSSSLTRLTGQSAMTSRTWRR